MDLATGSLLCMTENTLLTNSSTFRIFSRCFSLCWVTFSTQRRRKLFLKSNRQDFIKHRGLCHSFTNETIQGSSSIESVKSSTFKVRKPNISRLSKLSLSHLKFNAQYNNKVVYSLTLTVYFDLDYSILAKFNVKSK